MIPKSDKVRNFQVYKITNKINKKVYIGLTIRGADVRFKQHLTQINESQPISMAILKYGKANFEMEVLKTFSNEKEMGEYEKKMISECRNLLGQENVYNILDGGLGARSLSDSNIGKRKSEESVRKTSRSQRSFSDETLKQIIHSLKKDIHNSHEDIAKQFGISCAVLKKINSGRFFDSEKTGEKFPIRRGSFKNPCIEKELFYWIGQGLKSREVAKKIGVSQSKVLNCYHKAKNKPFEFKKTKRNYKEEEEREILRFLLEEVDLSMRQISERLSVPHGKVASVNRGKICFKADKNISFPIRTKGLHPKKRKEIIDISKNIKNISEISRITGIGRKAIAKIIKENNQL